VGIAHLETGSLSVKDRGISPTVMQIRAVPGTNFSGDPGKDVETALSRSTGCSYFSSLTFLFNDRILEEQSSNLPERDFLKVLVF
jgi:hypothetical protein